MARGLTLQAIRESQRENGDDVFLVLLHIDTGVDGPDRHIYLVNNTESVVSNGVTYIACPFSISLPDTNDVSVSASQITIDNVDTRIWQGLRALTGDAAWAALMVVMASEPDNIVIYADWLRLREAEGTNQEIRVKMLVDSVWQLGYPRYDFDPSQNPGMFTS
jgi:hypothetical protein